jgi:tetratricopeptide (TPR) repeat protein
VSLQERLPYPGLRAFAADETDLFFGREDCVYDMVQRLGRNHFLAVLGASGSGKSSLVRTGLLNGLVFGLLATAEPAWRFADCHPGGAPLHNLAAALLANDPAHPPGAETVASLEAFLARGPRSLIEWVNDGHLPYGCNLLVLIDQFEELFRYADYASREQAEAFVALLLETARAGGPIYVVITMRSDNLGDCALIPGLAEQINLSLYLTPRMTRAQCREAIEGPASVMGFDIEPRLVSHLLNDLTFLAPWEADGATTQSQLRSRQADQLPLMQHVLSRLCQLARRRSAAERPVLTLADYLASGQLGGTLDQHADEVRSRLSPPAQANVGRVFRALVDGTILADAVRKPLRFADLVAVVGAPNTVVAEIVGAFRSRDCNFLRTSDEAMLSSDTVIDISHESLIRQWNSLAGWFAEEAKSSELWSRLVSQQARHAAASGELLTGLDLNTALSWWDSEQPGPGWAAAHGGHFDDVRSFLQASRAREDQSAQEAAGRAETERRALKLRAVLYAGVAVICLIVAGYSWILNSRLSAANARLDTSTAELRESNSRLSNEDEKLGTLLVQESRDKQMAELANWMSLDAADRFVGRFAERLHHLPGISTNVVQTLLTDGASFLDELAKHGADRWHITRVRTRFARARAELLLEHGETVEARRIMEAAEQDFQNSAGNLPIADDAALDLAEIKEVEANILTTLNEQAAAEQKAQQAVDLLAAPTKAKPGLLLDQAKAEFWLAHAIASRKADDLVIDHTTRCLQTIEAMGAAQSDDAWFYRERCDIELALALYRQNKLTEERRYEDDAVASARHIPTENKTLEMYEEEARALSNLAFTIEDLPEGNGAHLPEVRDFLIAAANVLGQIPATDIRERPDLRLALTQKYRYVGDSFEKTKAYKEALAWYEKAYQAGTAKEDAWRNEPALADELDTVLDNTDYMIRSLNWRNDKSLAIKLQDVRSKDLEIVKYLIAIGKADWCSGCELYDMEEYFESLIDSDESAGQDRYDDAMKLAREIVEKSKAILANPPTPRHAIYARRAWFWTIREMLDSPEYMPSLHDHPEEQIARLQASRALAEDFLRNYPGVWGAQRTLGTIHYNLAKLLAAHAANTEALQEAIAGAELFNKESVELLTFWYKTGSGPVAQNRELARHYEAVLASRNWSLKRFTISDTKLTWHQKETKADWFLYIEDPRSDDDDPVARELHQLVTFEGVQIPESVAELFKKILKISKDNKVDFIGLATTAFKDKDNRDRGIFGMYDFDNVQTLDEDKIEQLLSIDLQRFDPAGAASELLSQWRGSDGEKQVTEALKKILAASTDPARARKFFVSVADAAIHDDGYALAEAVVNAVLNASGQDVTGPDLAALYRLRGHARNGQKNPAAADADYLAALALDPNDPNTLNEVAWPWVDADRQLPAAIDLLQRAVKLAPDNIFIQDSLGWAEVQIGHLDRGASILESVVKAQPNIPENLFHLGEAYRRLGRNEDATDTLAHAADLAKDTALKERIQRQLALVHPG